MQAYKKTVKIMREYFRELGRKGGLAGRGSPARRAAAIKANAARWAKSRAGDYDERLALERPGWRWADKMYGDPQEPRNPPEDALDLLAEARKSAPDAVLAYWTTDPREDDAWRGYCAIANFLGRDAVYGLPDDLRIK